MNGFVSFNELMKKLNEEQSEREATKKWCIEKLKTIQAIGFPRFVQQAN